MGALGLFHGDVTEELANDPRVATRLGMEPFRPTGEHLSLSEGEVHS